MLRYIKLHRTILTFFIISILNLVNVSNCDGNTCILGDGSRGECKLVFECAEVMRQLIARTRPNIVSCGFDGRIQIVCCSKASSVETNTSSRSRSSGNIKSKGRAGEKCNEYIRTMPVSVATQIIGGNEASLGEFPHMVALGYVYGADMNFDCGGTLISDKYAVTAAHCVVLRDRDPPILCRVGTVNLHGQFDLKDTDYYIEEIITHPEYKVYREYHDIALLRFNRSVSFSSMVFPACLNTDTEDPTSLMNITGWGNTNHHKISRTHYLMKASVSSVDISSCNTTYTHVRLIKLPFGLIDGQICAVDKNFKMDTCGGDSGGPLQVPIADSSVYNLIGVTSFGKACSGGIPAVYTRISSYLQWIEDHVWPIKP